MKQARAERSEKHPVTVKVKKKRKQMKIKGSKNRKQKIKFQRTPWSVRIEHALSESTARAATALQLLVTF